MLLHATNATSFRSFCATIAGIVPIDQVVAVVAIVAEDAVEISIVQFHHRIIVLTSCTSAAQLGSHSEDNLVPAPCARTNACDE